MSGTAYGFSNFFKNVHVRSRVLYTDYICKIVDQEQELFNFDRLFSILVRFIVTQSRS